MMTTTLTVRAARRWRQRRADERGTTLVELLVTMSIFTVVLVLTLSQLTQAVQRTTALDRASVAAGEARRAFDALTADLRQASAFTQALAPIAELTPTAMTFYSPDRSTPVRMRRISYRLNGATLERSEVVSANSGTAPWNFSATPTWAAVIGGVRNTDLFKAYDANGGITADLTVLRSVKVTVLTESSLSSSARIKYEVQITLRMAP